MSEVLLVGTPMRAKFKIESVLLNPGSQEIKFRAVYGGSTNAEDNTFSAATPSAECSMCVTNKALWGKYVPGQVFYVDFTPVMEK